MAGTAPEVSQTDVKQHEFDVKQYESKIQKILNNTGETEELFTSTLWDEVYDESVDILLRENLMKGIYANAMQQRGADPSCKELDVTQKE